jgi:glycosyltransferase involved in cell wall biosynthesis
MKAAECAEIAWPRVSVVIPTYNRARMVRRAIESVLAQNYPNLEVIVVDDGSVDGTRDVVAAMGEQVRYEWQPNAGASSARNRGWALAKGVYVAFLDSDDVYLPGKLHEQVQYMRQRPSTVLVYCWFSIVDEAGRVRLGRRCRLTGNVARKLVAQCMRGPLATPTVMVCRRALAATGGFDESMRLSEDIDLWCRLARLGPIGLVPEVLVQVNRHSGNLSTGPRVSRFREASLQILRKAFRDDPTISRIERLKLVARAHVWSWMMAVSRLLPEGLSFWARAFWTNPFATLKQVVSRRAPKPLAADQFDPGQGVSQGRRAA